MKQIRKFRIFRDIYTLNLESKTIQVNDNKPITFDKMNEIAKEYRGCNRIHKPIALLLYTDWKNGRINDYADMEI